MDHPPVTRRAFLKTAVAGAAALTPAGLLAAESGSRDEGAIETPPAEDLMREHGVLNRVLLIYDRFTASLSAGSTAQLTTLAAAAALLKRFIEDYHEKLEEEHVFPRFQGRPLGPLAATLKTQHEAGRKVTAEILRLSGSRGLAQGGRAALAENLRRFVVMYRPHEAREDTVLFPAFKKLVSTKEYHELGERFEEKERRLFGKDGFQGVVGQVAELEKSLGLHDLSQFTPAPAP